MILVGLPGGADESERRWRVLRATPKFGGESSPLRFRECGLAGLQIDVHTLESVKEKLSQIAKSDEVLVSQLQILFGSGKGVFWKSGLFRKVHFLENLEILERIWRF